MLRYYEVIWLFRVPKTVRASSFSIFPWNLVPGTMLRSLEPLPLAYAASYSKCEGPLNNQLWPFFQNCPAFKAPILIVISESKLYPHKPFLPKIVLLLLLHPPNQVPRKQCNGLPTLWFLRCPRLMVSVCQVKWIKVWRGSHLCPQNTRSNYASTRTTLYSVVSILTVFYKN